MSKTTSFGTSKRESHNSSEFYARSMYSGLNQDTTTSAVRVAHYDESLWANKIYQESSTDMKEIPDESVGLAFTSPPYNVGKDYEGDMSLDQYMSMIRSVAQEVYRVLKPGGRYVINIANLGRKPYIPLHSLFYELHDEEKFLCMGEIIWQKAKGASGSCAWGSWRSAKAPRLRDVHEYLLVFAKQSYSRPDKGASTLESSEFMESTLSIWDIPPESAKRVGHPAPFPVKLASRVVNLFSYQGDVVLDPFVGSGTTCMAAKSLRRSYVGYDISEEYCALAKERIAKVEVLALQENSTS